MSVCLRDKPEAHEWRVRAEAELAERAPSALGSDAMSGMSNHNTYLECMCHGDTSVSELFLPFLQLTESQNCCGAVKVNHINTNNVY